MNDRVDQGTAFLDQSAKARPTVRTPVDVWDPLERLWEQGLESGSRTGWPSLDEFYSVAPGQLTLITGYPSSGKSEFLDALVVNLSRIGWKFVMFSPENYPIEIHVAKFAEKLSGRPFGRGQTERMSIDELGRHTSDLTRILRFIQAPWDSSLTIPDIIAAATPALDDLGGELRGLVIDPWNEIEHWRPQWMSETEYVSHALSLLRNWARANSTHVWLVAHPQKLKRDQHNKLPVPTPDSISGSVNFWNKADCCLCVWRDLSGPDSVAAETAIYVQKVRFRHIGRRGIATLRYNRVTGQYSDPNAGPRQVAI